MYPSSCRLQEHSSSGLQLHSPQTYCRTTLESQVRLEWAAIWRQHRLRFSICMAHWIDGLQADGRLLQGLLASLVRSYLASTYTGLASPAQLRMTL